MVDRKKNERGNWVGQKIEHCRSCSKHTSNTAETYLIIAVSAIRKVSMNGYLACLRIVVSLTSMHSRLSYCVERSSFL